MRRDEIFRRANDDPKEGGSMDLISDISISLREVNQSGSRMD